ncbi:uncharacterized protein N0V89_011268, partial [Didymosphaeria variabile]
SLEVTRNGSLLIVDDRITGIFSQDEKPPALANDVEVIDATGKIITPGFVDTHRQNWQTMFRHLPVPNVMADYFINTMNTQVLQTIQPEDIYNTQLVSIYEGLETGVTTQLDHAHHPPGLARAEAALRASMDSGARIFHAFTVGTNGFDTPIADQVAEFKKLSEIYGDALNKSIVSLGVSCDAFSRKTEEELEPVLALIR